MNYEWKIRRRRGRRGGSWLCLAAFGLVIGLAPAPGPAQVSDEMTVYPAEYFAGLNVLTARDMVRRIPGSEAGGSQRRGRGGDRRGLRDQSDRILINGKRLIGKSNDASAFLQRLPAEQVLRIEVLDGIVMENEADAASRTINIVTSGDHSGSGNWQTSVQWTPDLGSSAGGRFSYMRNTESAGVSLGLEVSPRDFLGSREDIEFSGDSPVGREALTRVRESHDTELTATAQVDLPQGRSLRLNALYEEDPRAGSNDAEDYAYLGDGTQQLVGYEYEPTDRAEKTWEIGGTYEHPLDARNLLQLIFLRNEARQDSESRKSNFDTGGQLVEQNHEIRDEHARETVLRGTWFASRDAGREFDMGIELAVNQLDKSTLLFEGEPDPLQAVEIPNSDQVIREDRLEWFANYTFNRARTRVRLGLAGEYSEFDQQGSDVAQKRSLDYLKPSVDLSYAGANGRRMFLTFKRDVSQLDFDDFVAYIDPWDDEIRAGNPDLRPESSWDLELGSEHHFGDAGLVKFSLFHRWVEDVRDLILLEPDDSQPGNLPDGRHWGMEVDFGLRLDRFDLPGAVLNGSYKWQDSQTTDPFTGETRRFQHQESYEARLDFRHDVERFRGAYGLSWSNSGRSHRYDIDRTDVGQGSDRFELFIERRVGRALILRLSADRLNEPKSRRTRLNYEPDRATGTVDSKELRSEYWRRSVTLSLSGTF